MSEIKVLLCGALGAMGKVVTSLIAESDSFSVSCGFEPLANEQTEPFPIYKNLENIKEDVDVVIDFSHFSLTDEITKWCMKNKKPLVSAVTGISEESENLIKEASNVIPVFRSANFSYGVNVMKKIIALATRLLCEDFDIEVIEAHHNKKADAPSGTAKMLLDTIQKNAQTDYDLVYGRSGQCRRSENEIGVHAIRGGAIAGEHEVMYISDDEIITVHHSAISKRVFASGAVRAAKFIVGKPNGLYDMDDLVGE